MNVEECTSNHSPYMTKPGLINLLIASWCNVQGLQYMCLCSADKGHPVFHGFFVEFF